MPQKKQQPKSAPVSGNGTQPSAVPAPASGWDLQDLTVPSEIAKEQEGWSAQVASDEESFPTGKPVPQQTDWVVDEGGEPQPKVDTSVIPDMAGLATAVGKPESWETGEAQEAPDESWDAGGLVENLTLSIERHAGKFNASQVKMLIYGDTGVQKTRTAATFPDAIFLDVDHGMSSVDWEVDKVTIPDDETGFKKMEALYNFLAPMDHGYGTVVLDTLNEMQRVIMRFTVEEYTTVRRSYGSLPGQSDYGFMLYQFIELTRRFISLPMRVVLLAQVNSQQFETDMLGPQLIGKNTARDLLRKMDVVGFLYKAASEEGTHPEITFDAPNYATKDRSNKLPVALPNPTYDRIAAYWK